MGIDINTLNGIWKQIAEKADIDKKGVIDINNQKEMRNIRAEVKKLSPEEQALANSIFIENQSSESSEIGDQTNFTKKREKSHKTRESHALSIVNSADVRGEFKRNGDWDKLAENARTVLFNGELVDADYTKQLADKIDEVVNVVKQFEFHDRDSVMKLYKSAKDRLDIKKDDPFKEFKLDLLETFANFAEERQQKIEYDRVKKVYDALTKEPPKTSDDALKYLKGMFRQKFETQYNRNEEAFLNDKEVAATKTMLYIPAKTREEAMKIIKNSPDFKGSYFEDNGKYSVSEKIHHNPDVKHKEGVVSQLEESTVMTQARNAAWEAIKNQLGEENLLSCQKDENGNPIPGTGTKITDYKTVRAAAKAELQHQGKWDKYVEKAFTGELSFGQKLAFEESNIKSFEKTVAAYTRVEEIKQKDFVESDFADKLKDDSVFDALVGAGLVTKKTKQEGKEQTYDISTLSDYIRGYIGADLKANRQNKKFDVMSEVTRLRNGLFAKLNPPIFISEGDAKKLIRLCGFDVESKNWASTFYDALLGTVMSLPGAIAGAAMADAAAQTTATAVADLIIPVEVTHNQTGSMHCEFDLGAPTEWNHIDDIWDSFLFEQSYTVDDVQYHYDSENLVLEQTDKGFSFDYKYAHQKQVEMPIGVSQEDLNKNIDQNKKSDIAGAVIKSTLINLGMNMLRSLMKDNSFEQPIVAPIDSQKYDKMTAQQYKLEYLANNKSLKTPQIKQAFALLVDAFTEKDENGVPKKDGKFDAKGYQELLNRYSGDGGVLNVKELLSGATINPPKPEPKPEPKPVIEEKKNDVVDNNKKTDGCPDCDDIDKKLSHDWSRKGIGHVSWETIVTAKYPELVADCKKKGIGMYDKNGPIKILQRALCTDINGNFDKTAFYNLTHKDIPMEFKFPDDINGFKYNKDNSVGTVKINNNGNKSNKPLEQNKDVAGHDKFSHSTTCDENNVGVGGTAEEARANHKKQQEARKNGGK